MNARGEAAAAPVSRRLGLRPRKTSEYPKFQADGDQLVKIGWSKSKKNEYEHRAPKRVLEELARVLAEASKKNVRFSKDAVLPVVDPEDGSELPSYQVYLCLAWLRYIGLVQKHGKNSYTLRSNLDLHKHIDSFWAQLPDRLQVVTPTPASPSKGAYGD